MKRQPIEVYGFGQRLPTRAPRWGACITCAAVVPLLTWIIVRAPW